MSEVINISDNIINSINTIFSRIFSSVDNNIYEILDKLTFIDEEIMKKDIFINGKGKSIFDGIIIVSNALVIGYVLFYVLTYLFSHITYSKIQTPTQFVFKTIIFVLIMNNSYWISGEVINIVSLVSKAICDIGKIVLGQEISFANFITQINDKIYLSQSGIDISSFDGIIKSLATMGFMNLTFSYSLRYIMIQVFILITPFAILTLTNTKTEWIFKSIFKAFMMLLLEQILIAVVLLIAFSFSFSSSDTMSKILYVGIIYALMKTNTYMYMMFGGISTSISNGIGMLSHKTGN